MNLIDHFAESLFGNGNVQSCRVCGWETNHRIPVVHGAFWFFHDWTIGLNEAHRITYGW